MQIGSKVGCEPRGTRIQEILRARSHTPLTGRIARPKQFLLNYLSITNVCNFSCAVCATDAGPWKNAVYLTVEEICQRASRLKEHGGRVFHLFGGEPTLHPELLTIIRELRAMGLSLGLVTNGYRLGRDPELAYQLKASGLSRVCLQFDALDEEPLVQLGRNTLKEKHEAIGHALAAKLHLGLNCTVTKSNLHEVARLLDHGLRLGAGVKNMTFGVATPTGRFELDESQLVDREQVIKAMVQASGGIKLALSLDDFTPLPAFGPWRLFAHPDCGVHVPHVRTPWGIRPLNHYVDMEKLYRKLAVNSMASSRVSRWLVPAWYTLCSLRWRRSAWFITALLGMLAVRSRFSLVNVAVTDYRAAQFLDQERLERCASAFHTSQGPVEGCLHFFT